MIETTLIVVMLLTIFNLGYSLATLDAIKSIAKGSNDE
jgi:hypothetical protein